MTNCDPQYNPTDAGGCSKRKTRSGRSNILVVIGCIGAVFITIAIVNYFSLDKQKYTPNASWINGIGTLTKLDHGKSSSNKIGYVYNNIWYDEYSAYNVSIEGAILGEKYRIKIDPNSPERYFPLTWEPVFTNDDTTGYAKAEIIKVFRFRYSFKKNNNESDFGVRFVYFVDGKKFERGQNLPPDFKTIYPNLSKGQFFKLDYWKNNPQRAIVYLNDPIHN